MANIGTSLTHLNSQLSFYGTVQNKVAEATDFATKRDLQLNTQLSSLQDADLTSAIVELTQAQAQQSAALQVRAKTPPRSLFDFLGLIESALERDVAPCSSRSRCPEGLRRNRDHRSAVPPTILQPVVTHVATAPESDTRWLRTSVHRCCSAAVDRRDRS